MATSVGQLLDGEKQLQAPPLMLHDSTKLFKRDVQPHSNVGREAIVDFYLCPTDHADASGGMAGVHHHQQQSTEKKQPRRRRRRASADGGGTQVPKKRKLTDEQARSLELSFGVDRGLDSDRKVRLAEELGLDPRQVAVWFQNRRARWREQRLQNDHGRLHAALKDAVLHNHRLEAQILELRQKLGEAQKDLAQLSLSSSALPVHAISAEVNSNCSPSCSELSTLIDPADVSVSSTARQNYYHSHLSVPPPMLLGELPEEEEELLFLVGGVTDVCSIYDNGIWDWTL